MKKGSDINHAQDNIGFVSEGLFPKLFCYPFRYSSESSSTIGISFTFC